MVATTKPGQDSISIQVIYALPERAELISLKLPAGTTVQKAVESSGLLQRHPEINFDANKLGIFGKLTKPDAVLRDHDRIEIYRPLIADPKEVRRKRAEEGKATKKGGGALEG